MWCIPAHGGAVRSDHGAHRGEGLEQDRGGIGLGVRPDGSHETSRKAMERSDVQGRRPWRLGWMWGRTRPRGRAGYADGSEFGLIR